MKNADETAPSGAGLGTISSRKRLRHWLRDSSNLFFTLVDEVNTYSVMLSIVVIGLLVHGVFLSKLGLYRDDAWQFMQGMQAADGNTLSFILSDTSGYLLKERPFSYIPWTMARAAFAINLSMVHWLLAGLLILNAVVLASITHKIFCKEWFAFSVGVIFLTYPLSPMQTVMVSTVHYLFALLLTLLAIWFSLNALKFTDRRRLVWFIFGSAMYLASLLTHEEFGFIYPTFIGMSILWDYRNQSIAGRSFGNKHVVLWLSSFLVTLALYGLWRKMILPVYEAKHFVGLPSYSMVLDPALLLQKLIIGVDTVFIPWDQVLWQLLRFRPPIWAVLSAVIVFVATWAITFRLLLRSKMPIDALEEGRLVEYTPYWQALTTGMVLVMTVIGTVALSSTNRIDTINGFVSRVNFGTLIGIALGLPAVPVLLMGLYNRSAKRISLIVLTCLLSIALVHILLRRSVIAEVLDRYPINVGFVVTVATIGIILLFLTVIVFSGRRAMQSRVMPETRTSRRLIRAHLPSAIIAFLVLLGSLFHSSVKREWADAWQQHKSMLSELQAIAPALRDETFVLIDASNSNQLIKRVVTGGELSVHLLALYDNWSIMGLIITKGDSGWYFYRDGMEIPGGTWFPAGVRGPVVTHATMSIPRISYDRFILFEFDGNKLRSLPKIEVKTVEGDHLVLHDNPERILARAPVTTAIWRHVTQ